MIAVDKGFVQGTVVAQGPMGNLTFVPGPTQALRLVAIEFQNGEPWNENIGQNAITSGVAEMNAVFAGQGTIAQHAANLVSSLGLKLNSTALSALTVATTAADKLIGKKVTVEDGLGVAVTALGQAGVLPANLVALFPSVEAAVEGILGIKK